MGRAVRGIARAVGGVAKKGLSLAKGVAGAAMSATPLGQVANMAMKLSAGKKQELVGMLSQSMNGAKG